MRTTVVFAAKVRRRPLAAGVASIVAWSGPALAGASLPVTSCLDDNVGQTLRVVVGAAASGDTVDLSGLTGPSACVNSVISLQTAQIVVTQDDLTIKGPGAGTLAINGSSLPYAPGDSRLFRHAGSGTLTFRDIGLQNGHIYHDSSLAALGACVYSSGGLELYATDVASCSAYSTDGYAQGGALFASGSVKLHGSTITKGEAQSTNSYAQGGGIWAKGDVLLDHSSVSGNTTTASGTFADGGGVWANGELTLQYGTLGDNTAKSPAKGARGGGAFVNGAFSAEYSTVSGNSTQGEYTTSNGGGVYTPGSIACRHSTVSGNHADGAGGGLVSLAAQANANTVELKSSTISGNTSGFAVGGVLADAATVLVYNSTIALNSATGALMNNYTYAPGLALSAVPAGVQATLQSSLLANNLYGGNKEDDLSAATTLLHPVTFDLASANNFVRAYSAAGLPNDTLNKSCPLLGPLRDNGGPTWTHALLSTSIAINAGNNAASEAEDQRGVPLDAKPLPYPRESPDTLPDIGAYEVNQDEVVFDSGFDGCLDL